MFSSWVFIVYSTSFIGTFILNMKGVSLGECHPYIIFSWMFAIHSLCRLHLLFCKIKPKRKNNVVPSLRKTEISQKSVIIERRHVSLYLD